MIGFIKRWWRGDDKVADVRPAPTRAPIDIEGAEPATPTDPELAQEIAELRVDLVQSLLNLGRKSAAAKNAVALGAISFGNNRH